MKIFSPYFDVCDINTGFIPRIHMYKINPYFSFTLFHKFEESVKLRRSLFFLSRNHKDTSLMVNCHGLRVFVASKD